MDRNDITSSQKRVQAHSGKLAVIVRAAGGVVSHVCAECGGDAGELYADLSKPDDAEFFAVNFADGRVNVGKNFALAPFAATAVIRVVSERVG